MLKIVFIYRDERRNYNNEFSNWRHDLLGFGPYGPQRLHPKSATRRTAENVDSSSSEETVTNSPLGK